MIATISHGCALACINAVSCVAFVSSVRSKGTAIPTELRWWKLAIVVSNALKVAAFCIDLNIVPPFDVAIAAGYLALAFDVKHYVRLEHLPWLLDTLNTPITTHQLALVSILIDILVTPMSLTFTAWPLQGVVACFGCISLLCSLSLLFFPPSHSTVASQDYLLSARRPLENLYTSTMSVIRDDLLDDLHQHSKSEANEQDYLREFKAYLFDQDKLTLSLKSLLWTLRKPAIIIAAFATVQAICICGQAVLVYVAISLLTNHESTSYASFLHCALSFATLYCATAILEAKVSHFTVKLTMKLRTCILSLVGEKVLRLPRPVVIETDISTLLGAELDVFLAGIRTAPVGLANMIQICCAVFGLTFIMGNVAYLALACILGYFGYSAYATAMIQPAKDAFEKKRKKRLVETQPIMQDILSIKTLGLQSYYLALLKSLRMDEVAAWKTLRTQMAAFKHTLMGSYSISSLTVLFGLAHQKAAGQSNDADDTFPTLMVLCILGESVANAQRGFNTWHNFRYLQHVLNMLNMEDVPLRLEGTVEECATSATTVRVRNFSNHQLTSCDDTLVLKSVNLELFQGDFLLVWGRNGSGKTTFLNAILGEQTIKAALIHVADTSIAYCGQDTWLPDTNVQDCITGGLGEVEEARYRAVVVACRLPIEMTSLAYSSVAKIGPNGCHLSRTNRVKMILARATYAQASIVILDDTFATFDTTEATELAKSLLNPESGLLRLNRATVILASHSFAIPALVDDVYCLATRQFIVYPTAENSTTNHSSSDVTLPQETITASTPPAPALDTNLLPIQHDKNLHPRDVAKRISFQKNIAFIWNVMGDNKTWRGLSLCVVLIVVIELPLVLSLVMWPQFGLPVYVALALQLALSGMYYLCTRIVLDRITDVMSALLEASHEKIASKIMNSSSSMTCDMSAAQLLNLLGNDLEILNTSPQKLDFFSACVAWISLSMAFLFWSTNYSVTAVLGTIICFTMIQHTWGGISKRATECSDHAKQKMNAKYAEITDGLAYIRGFGWEQQMLRQLTRAINESEAASSVALSIEPLFKTALNLYWVLAFSSTVVYSFCHMDIISPNMLGVGILTLACLPDMASMSLTISMDMKELVAATDRIRQFLTNSDRPEAKKFNPKKDNENWAAIPDIIFENAEIGSNPPLNGKISETGHVLVQGCNGSGKTSLLLALLGMREYKGSIRIGGIEARDLNSDAISQISSITPQDPIKFPGTLESNLYLRESGQPETKATSDAVNELLNGMLEMLGLFHLSGPAEDGYKKLVSEIPLSQGQIVLVNLVRCAMDVLQKKKRIVLIDDVFSKLDKDYADMARDFISRAFGACIVIQAETTNAPHLSIQGVQPLTVGAAEIGFHPLPASQFYTWDEEIRQYFRSLRSAGSSSGQASASGQPSSTGQAAQTDNSLSTDPAAPAEQASSSSQVAPAGDVSFTDQTISLEQEQSTSQAVPTDNASCAEQTSHATPALSDTSHAVQGPSVASSSRSKPIDPWLQPRRPPPPRPSTATSKALGKMSSAQVNMSSAGNKG